MGQQPSIESLSQTGQVDTVLANLDSYADCHPKLKTFKKSDGIFTFNTRETSSPYQNVSIPDPDAGQDLGSFGVMYDVKGGELKTGRKATAMIMKVVPVTPPELRPLVPLDG